MKFFMISLLILFSAAVFAFLSPGQHEIGLAFKERLQYPGYGTCGRCGRPWATVQGHITMYHRNVYENTDQIGIYDMGDGCFPLCETCWQSLTPEQRLPYYRELIDQWKSDGRKDHNGIPWDVLWAELKKNVLAGE